MKQPNSDFKHSIARNNDLRYNDLNSYLRARFGVRVQKIAIDAGFTCPNRDGTLSFGGCLFCGAKGSGTGASKREESITQQITQAKARLSARYKAKKFLVYFQAFTNTYASCDVLREKYDEAMASTDIVGLSIGTRPDCIDDEKLSLIQTYAEHNMVWIEYGLQSIHDRTLKILNRRHTLDDFLRAVDMTRGRNILTCAHVILGLPGESKQDIVETAKVLSQLNVNGVKIHGLYVSRDSMLAQALQAGTLELGFLSQQTFAEWTVAFLEHLRPDIVVQRLTGDPDPATLLEPQWALNKQHALFLIQNILCTTNTRQGARWAL